MPPIEIFRPVQAAPSMEGVSVTLSAADLQAIAAGYDPSRHEAPCVIGHPTHDAPAYGWVKSLSFADGALQADCEQSAELGELVSRGHYKKVSASFYTPGAPGNPTPGAWALRHIGFLGAQAPGVKGLRAVSFAETEDGVVTFGELPGYAGGYVARMLGSLREWILAKYGKEAADAAIPSYEVESLREISQRAQDFVHPNNQFSGGTPVRSFGEPGNAATPSPTARVATPESLPMKTVEQLQAELDASNKSLQEHRDADAAREATSRATAASARHEAHVSFAEGLVAAAKWPAAARDVLVKSLDVMGAPGEGNGVVSFGEGEAARPLATAFMEQLNTLPASVSFGEFATGGANGQAAMSDREIASRASSYQSRLEASGQRITVSAAIDAVKAGNDKA